MEKRINALKVNSCYSITAILFLTLAPQLSPSHCQESLFLNIFISKWTLLYRATEKKKS